MTSIFDSYVPKFVVDLNRDNDDIIRVSSSLFSAQGDIYTVDRRTLNPVMVQTTQSVQELQPEVSNVYPFKIVTPIDNDGSTVILSPSVETFPTASQGYYVPIYFERYNPEFVQEIDTTFTELIFPVPTTTTTTAAPTTTTTTVTIPTTTTTTVVAVITTITDPVVGEVSYVVGDPLSSRRSVFKEVRAARRDFELFSFTNVVQGEGIPPAKIVWTRLSDSTIQFSANNILPSYEFVKWVEYNPLTGAEINAGTNPQNVIINSTGKSSVNIKAVFKRISQSPLLTPWTACWNGGLLGTCASGLECRDLIGDSTDSVGYCVHPQQRLEDRDGKLVALGRKF